MATRRTWLLASLAVAFFLGGCGSVPEPAEAPPGEKPGETPARQPAAESPGPLAPDETAWAVSQAPADACLIATVRRLDELEKNLQALVGPDGPAMPLVAEIEKQLPPGALDSAGPMVFVLAAGESVMPVFLLRIKDEAALKGEAAGSGIIVCTSQPPPPPGAPPDFKMPEKKIFIFKRAPWAVVGPSIEAVKAVMRAERHLALTGDQRAAIADRTLWAHVNPTALAAAARRGLDDLQKRMAEPGQGGAVPPATLQMLDWLLGMAKDAGQVNLAADVTAAGVTVEAEVELAEGSQLLTVAAAARPIEDFACGLPATEHLMLAAWGRVDWDKAIPAVKTLVKPLFDIFAEGENEATRKGLDELWAAYDQWTGVMGPRFAMVMEPAPPGQGLYRLTETFDVTDPDAYRKLMKQYMTKSMDATKVMMAKMGPMPGLPGMAGPQVSVEADFREAAETIEGTPVDVMRIRTIVAPAPGAPPEAAAQMKKTIDAMYGPEGIVIRMALVGNRGVVAMGDAQVMARAIQAAKGQTPDLVADPQVAAAVKRVPKDAVGAGLVSLGNYIYMAMNMVDGMMAASVPPDVQEAAKAEGLKPLAPPPPADPVVIAVRVDDRVIRTSLVAPAADIRAAVAVGKQAVERLTWFQKKMHERRQAQPPAAPAPPPAP